MPVQKPVAVVGLGAILPDAMDVASFWSQIKSGHYSITDVPGERWDPGLYYDPDPSVPDKTYSKIGGWVRGFKLEPFKMGIAIPPSVIGQMDEVQQWAIAAAYQALADYGYPKRKLDQSRTAVILGNALGGEKHYISTMRIRAPEFMRALESVPAFQGLPVSVQQALLEGMRDNIRMAIPEITEDTMPGELGNIIAGRVANVFNFQGPNFITDAACASSLAALQAAVEGLNNYQFDTVLTGGADRMMGVEGFVKFCKIGALSPDGSRPYADGANGFVMGEGTGVFLLKRLEDAERDGDAIYAVVRGIGSSSDGKGKGITAPNPSGQIQALERAWKNAGLSPETAGMIEGHGTSTRVGDVVEVNSLNQIFGQIGLPKGKIALGSVKSNIGHLKSAAGAAGLLKAVLSLHEKVLPPSVNFDRPNPNIEFSQVPFAVNTHLRPWETRKDEVRRAGVSSFGFGGTNFHVVLDEYIPGVLAAEPVVYRGVEVKSAAAQMVVEAPLSEPLAAVSAATDKQLRPYRGLLFLGAESAAALKQKLANCLEGIRRGEIPPSSLPEPSALRQPERLAIDYKDGAELLKRAERAFAGFDAEGNPWQALVAHGVFRGSGAPGKVAFLFPGQGSQYVNMLKDLCEVEPVVADTFAEADRIMTPILGRPLTSFIYVDGDESAVAEAELALRNTEITQPAMLTANVAMLRLMHKFGFNPDMVIGHSLGEYAGLVASGVLTFAEALEVVSARGREMKKVSWDDNGCMAAVSAPIGEVEKIIQTIDGYVVIANINSPLQCVIGGTTQGVEAALEACKNAGYQGTKIPVSHAFHTKIVEPASGPLRQVIERMSVQPPKVTIVANVTGEEYPRSREEIIDILARQVASPVQFIKGVETLRSLGAQVFVEIGPKRVLNALATDILKGQNGVTILATNHPREGAVVSFNKALCGLFAAGVIPQEQTAVTAAEPKGEVGSAAAGVDEAEIKRFALRLVSEKTGYPPEMLDMDLDLEADLGIDTVKQAELFAAVRTHYQIPRREDLRLSDYNTLEKVVGFVKDALSQGLGAPSPAAAAPSIETASIPFNGSQPAAVVEPLVEYAASLRHEASDGFLPLTGSVVISGAGLGLPGRNGQVFDDDNIQSILNGEIRIEALPEETRRQMLDKRVTRLLKSEAGAVMHPITRMDETVKLGGQRGAFDLAEEFGVPADRVEATDISTQLAIAAGIEALRDAGIPLVMAYRQTSKGTYLPDRWKLPEALADETGVIFGSAFPGLDEMAGEAEKYYEYQGLGRQIAELQKVLEVVPAGQTEVRHTLEQRIAELTAQQARLDYQFDRRFVFRILSMGHSQFAEYIGARGPNTHVNAACATTTHALSVAEDWIRMGRARRVIVVAGDDVTSGPLSEWVGTGLMASGAATIEGDPRLAILPFDRRRNGMIMGMGAAALVVESEDAVRERGMRGICEVLATQIANSAYHGTRLDTQHVGEVMERLVMQAEARFGLRREHIAGQTVFVSHETYTPARGGSASAEIRALRRVFGEHANQVVVANTKGYTGHTMGVGVEDVVAVKALEYGIVPPIANIRDGFEPDPDLGDLRLSQGGKFGVNYALRLGAGFGSQIAMSLTRKIAGDRQRISEPQYREWLARVAGYDRAELVVEKRTLRVRHDGPPVRPPLKSTWQFGQGPTQWAEAVESRPEAPAAIAAQPGVQEPYAPQLVPALAATPPLAAAATRFSAGQAEVREFVLKAVSEKTGYPVEMLDLDLDLEADLGIDTVKQAELFATIRTHFDIPRRDDLRLSDYNTLTRVIGFMQAALAEKAGDGLAAAAGNVSMVVETAPDQPETTAISEDVQAFVLQAVSEKTGYPIEMLDLDLDLEADLGIDTVKQAELFATIRTHYDIPRREDLRLSDYNTLSKVIGFMHAALEEKAGLTAAPRAEVEEPLAENETPAESAHLMTAESSSPTSTKPIPRRMPVAALRPKLEICSPIGVSLTQGSRILVVGDSGKTGDHLAKKLRALGAEVMLVSGMDPAEALNQAGQFAAVGGVQGVYYLPALDIEPVLPELTLETWNAEVDRRILGLFRLVKSLAGEPFLVCGTRMGGLSGYGAEAPGAPLGGLVSGFTKAFARERPQVLIKVVDFEPSASPANIAARLLGETLQDPSAVEVGWRGDLRFSPALVDSEAGPASMELAPETVYVVSGGSGGITAPVVLDLAQNAGGRFYLLSRTPLPDPTNPDLQALQADRAGFKVRFAQRLREMGEKATPAAVDQKVAALERAVATMEMMSVAQKSGARVTYLVCDVTDTQACEAAIRRVLAETGRIDVLIHAAGVDHSRKMETKTEGEFRQTLAVKANGFFNLFKAMEKAQSLPKAVVFFSSLAGRFGNSGQTDYAAANDLLCKLALALPAQYPGMRSIALDWGAWAEVGLASRGYIPELMKRAGIEMLAPQQAAPLVRRELIYGKAGSEVLLAGDLGLLAQERKGGLEVEKANLALEEGSGSHPIRARVTGFDLDEGVVLEEVLDPTSEPFLRDHALNGIPLLPGVMGIEGLSIASKQIADALASEKNGFQVTGLDNIQFLAALKFYRNRPRTAIWKARVYLEDGALVADARLETMLARFGQAPEPMLHFTARVHLEPLKATRKHVVERAPQWNGQLTLNADEIYKFYFHGPSFQVLEAVQNDGDEVIGKLQSKLPPFSAYKDPVVTAPMLVELCMQTAGVWEIGRTGTLALPRSIASLKVFQTTMNGARIFAEVKPQEVEDGQLRFDARVVDEKGRLYLEMRDYRTAPLPYSMEKDQLETLQAWMANSKE